jgi:hypothetical protein
MGLKISRGGRVAVATVFAILLLSLAFVSAFKLAPQAQPTHSPCSRSCAACASASPGSALRAVNVEWLNGSERASAVEKALSLEEFRKVASVLEKLGYKPAPEKALAVRFEREVKGRLAKHLLVAVPFEGGEGEKFAFVIALLEPSAEALAFKIDLKARVMKLVARAPVNRPSLILPQAKGTAQLQAAVGVESSGCTSPQPDCGSCGVAFCVCDQWDLTCLFQALKDCSLDCLAICEIDPTGIACILCITLYCPWIIGQCCLHSSWYCYDCYPYHCHEWVECCDRCQPCWNDPECPCYPNCGQ